MTSSSSRNAIAIITTGGTIASSYDQSLGSHAPNDSIMQNLIDQVLTDIKQDTLTQSSQAQLPHYDIYPLLSKDSSQLTWEDVQLLASVIQENADNYQAIVVVHGTDTMEESAFFVQAALNPSVPVIFTGAMYPSDHHNFDGATNLRAAMRDCAVAHNGVWVRMGANLIPAIGCYKTASGFASYCPARIQTADMRSIWDRVLDTLVSATKQQPVVLSAPQSLTMAHNYGSVPLITSFLGDDGAIIRLLAQQSTTRAIVVEALGGGNLAQACQDAVIEINTQIPVIITSRVCQASLSANYVSATQLVQADVIMCDILSPVQVRLLLEILYFLGASDNDIRQIFSTLAKIMAEFS